MNARPIWTQSGTGPKFIRSRVNGALIRGASSFMIYLNGAVTSPLMYIELDRFLKRLLVKYTTNI